MSEDIELSLQCYNRGCGKKYKSSENGPESCVYHSGEPFFHDAYKGWSCCNKKSIDFTTFLSIPPCTRGYHSNIKPDNINKLKEVTKDNSKELIGHAVKHIQLSRSPDSNEVRPSSIEEMTNITITVSEQYRMYLDEAKLSPVNREDPSLSNSNVCTNSGCKATKESKDDICIFHPGKPVFHEGMKYWSCCQKKTTDFNNFLSQPGCERGEHNWNSQQSSIKEDILNCRLDMYQISRDCVVSIFAKNINPQSCQLDCNRVKLRVSFECHQGKYENVFELFGVICPEQCKAVISQSKLEITLRKNRENSWPRLTL